MRQVDEVPNSKAIAYTLAFCLILGAVFCLVLGRMLWDSHRILALIMAFTALHIIWPIIKTPPWRIPPTIKVYRDK